MTPISWNNFYNSGNGTNEEKHLSMVLSSSYASYALIDVPTNRVATAWAAKLKEVATPARLLADKINETNLSVKSATCAIGNSDYMLQPGRNFPEASARSLLEFQTGKKVAHAQRELLLEVSATGIYPKKKEEDALPLKSKIPQLTTCHAATVFTEVLARVEKHASGSSLYILDRIDHCWFALYREGHLLFSNSFKTDNLTDVLYYSLLTFEQLEIDRTGARAICLGRDKARREELENELSKFVSARSFNGSVVCRANSGITQEMAARHFLLLHQHLCAS